MDNTRKECYDALKAAVVRQACDDYYWFLRHPGKKITYDYDAKRRRRKQDDERSLKRWFHSKIFGWWCGEEGEAILDQLRKNHAEGFKYHTVDEFD